MEVPIKEIKEFFAEVHRSLNKLEEDIEAQDESLQECAFIISKIFISKILEVKDEISTYVKLLKNEKG